MRLASIAILATFVLATPAWADAASDLAAAKATIAAANLSEESDLDMWCGAAFTLAAVSLDAAGNATDAALAKKAADALFGKAAPLLTGDGVAEADLGNISTQYMVVANAQMIEKSEEAEHTQEECQTAATAL